MKVKESESGGASPRGQQAGETVGGGWGSHTVVVPLRVRQVLHVFCREGSEDPAVFTVRCRAFLL